MTTTDRAKESPSPASLITPDQVKDTLDRVRSGKVIDLSVPIAAGTPRLQGQTPFFMSLYSTPAEMRRNFAAAGMEVDIGFALERVEMDLHTGTHVDALGHIAIGDAMAAGRTTEEVVRLSGLLELGAEEIPSFVSRGVMIDVAALHGVAALPLGHVVSADDLRSALGKTDQELRKGDVVLVNTGWLDAKFADASAYPGPGFPGIGLDAADMLIEGGAIAIGVDNIAVEPLSSQSPADLAQVHARCLVEAGVFLIENVVTAGLVEEGLSEFAFLCAPVKFQGGTGGLARPLAIV